MNVFKRFRNAYKRSKANNKDKNMIDPDDFHVINGSIWATIFAGLCGALSDLIEVSEGKAFSWKKFILHGCVSAVAGLITYQVLFSLGTSSELSGAMSGVAGWMGTDSIRLIQVLLLRKFGIDPKELDKDQGGKKND